MHIYANTLLPIPNDVVLDKRLRNVVDHERLVGEHLHKLLRHCEVLRVDEDVVGEIVLLQKTDSTQKVLAKEEGVVRFILNLSCYYNTEAVRCDGHPSAGGSVRRTQATVRVRDDVYALVDILRTKIHPSDNALDYVRILFRQIQKELCFFFRLASLYRHSPIHPVATDATFQLRRKEVSAQRLHVLVQPGKGLRVTTLPVILPRVRKSKSVGARRYEGLT